MRKGEKLLHGALRAAGAAATALCLAFSVQQLHPAGLAGFAAALWQHPAAVFEVLQQQWQQDAEPARGGWKPGVIQGQNPNASPTPAPTATPSPTPAPTPTPSQEAVPEGTLPIVEETFRQGSGDGYVQLTAGSIKNATGYSDAELQEAARGGVPFDVERNSSEPQVLILHTHATESYQSWDGLYYDPTYTARSQDTSENMCAVGARMAQILNEAGIYTLHDETLHDSPSYTESYDRSAATAKAYLEQYPSIKVILDVHRDALERDQARVKPVTTIDGEAAAQVMIISGCSNGGTVNLPHWRMNLQFAAAWETEMETLYPTLTRPVYCAYRYYNQDLLPGCLLIEIGGHANTLEEALRAGELAARALASLFGASAVQATPSPQPQNPASVQPGGLA